MCHPPQKDPLQGEAYLLQRPAQNRSLLAPRLRLQELGDASSLRVPQLSCRDKHEGWEDVGLRVQGKVSNPESVSTKEQPLERQLPTRSRTQPSWFGHQHGCGSKMWAQNGTLVNGNNKD